MTREEVELAVKKLQVVEQRDKLKSCLMKTIEGKIDWLLKILQEVWRTKQLPSE